MVQVSSSVIITGASNIGGSIKHGLKLNTTSGQDFFNRVQTLFKTAKKENKVEFYKKYLYNKREDLRKELSKFLNDDSIAKLHKMDDKDVEGWKIYKELVDEWDVLTYFMGKK